MKSKKGAEMTIGTIIIIVLALIVLVVLIYGFSTGWTNLWEKITAFGGGKINVQTVVQSCQLACTTGSRYDYCVLPRKVIFGDKEKDKDKEKRYTCNDIEGGTTGLDDCGALRCETGENCEDINERNELMTGITECPAGTAIKPSADTTPLAGEERKAWCCQKKSLDATEQVAARLADCKAATTSAKCTALGCTTSECTIA